MLNFRALLATVLVAVSGFAWPGAANAIIGMGPFFEYGRGIGLVESRNGDNLDYDANRYSVGFALDTAVAKDRLFNYRLNLGYTHRDQDFDNGRSLSYDGLTLNNMFGFGVYRDSRVRLWLGPSVRFNADFASGDTDLGIGGGFALGVNVHTDEVGSAAFTFGYQYLYVESLLEDAFFDDDLDGRQHLLSFNLTYFFRLPGDEF